MLTGKGWTTRFLLAQDRRLKDFFSFTREIGCRLPSSHRASFRNLGTLVSYLLPESATSSSSTTCPFCKAFRPSPRSSRHHPLPGQGRIGGREEARLILPNSRTRRTFWAGWALVHCASVRQQWTSLLFTRSSLLIQPWTKRQSLPKNGLSITE
jgi:hypothetical protein